MERYGILTACNNMHNNHNDYVDNFIYTVEHIIWISENKSNVSIPSLIADLVAR